MLIEKIIERQSVDARKPANFFTKFRRPDQLLPAELDPMSFGFPADYNPPTFPLPSLQFDKKEWPQSVHEQTVLVQAAYQTFASAKNTLNALSIAALAVANLNWFLAACWFQSAAIHGSSTVAMAELSAIFSHGLDTEKNLEAAGYWYQKSDRILSGMLFQAPQAFAAEIAGKSLMELEIFRRFTDPSDPETFNFSARPPGKLFSIQINPFDIHGICDWSYPTYIASDPPGNELYECRTKTTVYFDLEAYKRAEAKVFTRR